MTNPISDYLTTRGVAELTGRDTSIVSRAMRNGTLPSYQTGDGHARLVKRDDALAWHKIAKQGRPKISPQK
ncbi:MAG: hypothetical protein QM754_18440 [Tepidisphaeraceae bacterium]